MVIVNGFLQTRGFELLENYFQFSFKLVKYTQVFKRLLCVVCERKPKHQLNDNECGNPRCFESHVVSSLLFVVRRSQHEIAQLNCQIHSCFHLVVYARSLFHTHTRQQQHINSQAECFHFWSVCVYV